MSTVNQAYSQLFKSPYPARTCYQVAALPQGAVVEIEAIISLG
ncbi:Rid family hydrolase [Brucella intermedia]|nr:Rid family hydrolase [Brucella intermedia]